MSRGEMRDKTMNRLQLRYLAAKAMEAWHLYQEKPGLEETAFTALRDIGASTRQAWVRGWSTLYSRTDWAGQGARSHGNHAGSHIPVFEVV